MVNTKKQVKDSTPSANQLIEYKKANEPQQLTTDYGRPIGDREHVISVGPRGPLLLGDFPFIEDIQRFNRERIPERVVHGKGAGAFGVFEATDDISDICKAKVFNVGTKARVLTRFSIGDSIRDPRGFAVKMYTDEGIWDLTGSHSPIFFIRDPFLFSSLVHSQKRNPQTHLLDPNMAWDFFANHPQTVHHTLLVYSNRGVPDGYRFMHGYGSHTFKMVNDKNEHVWVKFHLRCDQGIKNLDPMLALRQGASEHSDYATADLFDAIAMGNYPSWTLFVQVMTDEQAKNCPFDPFDLTKVFPQKEYPLRKVGKLTLNENPTNYFAQIEQAAFTPAHMPPGIEASPDKMLQARLFAYADAHLYRVGTNNLLIPVNNPETNKNVKVCSFARDGSMQTGANCGGCPVYHGNSYNGPVVTNRDAYIEHGTFASGMISRHLPVEEDNYSQARTFYTKVLNDQGRAILINNVAASLAQCTDKNIVHRSLAVLANVDTNLEAKIMEKLKF